jgi:hypothetical protein
MIRQTMLTRLAVALTLGGFSCDADAAFLDGKTMVVDRTYRELEGQPQRTITSDPFIVGPGVELEDFGASDNPPPLPGLVDIDISDARIVMTLVIDQPAAFFDRLRVIDALNEIEPFTDVRLNPATNWAGLDSGRLFDSPGLIAITVSGLSGLAGQQVVIDLIPEPGSAALAGLAAVALVRLRRRRVYLQCFDY